MISQVIQITVSRGLLLTSRYLLPSLFLSPGQKYFLLFVFFRLKVTPHQQGYSLPFRSFSFSSYSPFWELFLRFLSSIITIWDTSAYSKNVSPIPCSSLCCHWAASLGIIFGWYSRSLFCVLNYTCSQTLIPSYVCMCTVVCITKETRKITSWGHPPSSQLPPTSSLWMQRTAAESLIYL